MQKTHTRGGQSGVRVFCHQLHSVPDGAMMTKTLS